MVPGGVLNTCRAGNRGIDWSGKGVFRLPGQKWVVKWARERTERLRKLVFVGDSEVAVQVVRVAGKGDVGVLEAETGILDLIGRGQRVNGRSVLMDQRRFDLGGVLCGKFRVGVAQLFAWLQVFLAETISFMT